MPFSPEFLKNASKELEVANIKGDFEIVAECIKKAVAAIAKVNSNVNPKNVDIYIHGSYANKTNIFFPSNLEVCVELKKTKAYVPSKIAVIDPEPKKLPEDFVPQYRMYNNYFVKQALDFPPEVFRKLLFQALSEITGQKCTQNEKCIVVPAFGKLRHVVEITPCFSFDYHEGGTAEADNGAVFKGVLLYDAGVHADIVTFPKLHAQNGHAKDLSSKGNFKKTVRLFKTLNAIYAREHETEPTRGYFVECLLFNVPDRLFVGTDNDVFLKVINYLSNCDMDNFACQNLVWHLFGTAGEFWMPSKARRFIQQMSEQYKTFPEKRTLLA